MQYQREEGLAHILTAHFADLPPSDADIAVFTANLNPIVAFSERIVHTLHSLLALTSLVRDTTPPLVQDAFRRHKVLVAVSSVGMAYGIDTHTAGVLWTRPLDQAKALRAAEIVQLRSALYGEPLVALVLQPADATDGGRVLRLNPLTGEPNGDLVVLSHPVRRVLPVPHATTTAEHFNLYALLLADGSVRLVPDDVPAAAARSPAVPLYTHVVDVASGSVEGFRVETPAEGPVARRRWKLQLTAPGETLVAMTHAHSQDPVASAGEILGDKSVMYKYLNPNLLAVATLSAPVKKASRLSVQIVDTVRGAVLQHVTHDGVTGPVHLATAENWLLYSFRDRRNKRNNLNVIELFDPMDKVRLAEEGRAKSGEEKSKKGKEINLGRASEQASSPTKPWKGKRQNYLSMPLHMSVRRFISRIVTSRHCRSCPFSPLCFSENCHLAPRGRVLLSQERTAN